MSGSFFSELKRRNVFKATAGYVLLGWVVLQIADVVVPALNLPDWTMTLLLVIGLFGLPFVIFFSWVYELTPDGLKLTKEVDSAESVTHTTGKKLEYVIIGFLSVSLLLVIVKPNVLPNLGGDDEPQVTTSEAAQRDTEEAIPSIAVLPFADFSPEKDQGYFSDGISEEILNLLAKTNRLRVAARTSSFAFKGDNSDIREIGEKLEVETVLEGSIRKSNNTIRVTAQLINVADGYHIWSETYDRELKDVFAIQDEISTAILNSLKVHLLGEELKDGSHEVDLQAYDKFLIANERLQRNSRDDLLSAIELLEEAIAIQPDYTEAKIKLVLAALQMEGKANDREEFLEREKITDQFVTVHLDPIEAETSGNFELNGVLGRYHQKRYRNEVSQAYLAKALELNANYADAYLLRADNHFQNADYKAMLADREKAYKLDPMSIEISRELAYDYLAFWRPDDADKIIERMFDLFPDHPTAFAVRANNYASRGMYADAVLVLEQAVQKNPDNERFKNFLAWGYTYLNKPDKVASMDRHWTDYEMAMRLGNIELGLELLAEGLASDKREEWLTPAADMYMLTGDIDKLKSTIVESIALMDKRNVPWDKRCDTYLIAALRMVDMNDNIQTMMDECRKTTLKRLEAGFLCPCSWYRLVSFAIVDNRPEDAVKRAVEWLDNGDSDPKLKIDPLFIRLQDHEMYDTLLQRNDAQVERQIRIYDTQSSTSS